MSVADDYRIAAWHADERALTITVIDPLQLVGEFRLLARSGEPDDDCFGRWEYACPPPPHGPGGHATLDNRREFGIAVLDKLVDEHPCIPHAVNLHFYRGDRATDENEPWAAWSPG